MPKDVISTLPLDVLVEILELLTPKDLAHLVFTSRTLKGVLLCEQNKTRVWKTCRQRFLIPIPDPPLFEVSRACWSECAYAMWLFCGGPCHVCKTYTDEIPFSFSTNIRLCFKTGCRQNLQRDYLVTTEDANSEMQDLRTWLPGLELEGLSQFYVLIHLKRAMHEKKVARWISHGERPRGFNGVTRDLAELEQHRKSRVIWLPLIMQNARALQTWKQEIRPKRDEIRKRNWELAGTFAGEERCSKALLDKVRAFRVGFAWFQNNCEQISAVWFKLNRNVIVREIAILRSSVQRPQSKSQVGNIRPSVPCDICKGSRRFDDEGKLRRHNRHRHGIYLVDTPIS